MSSQICLKWNSFLNNIATNFESLWEEEGLVDVTLASDGQCLTAHKVILSASSPFFKKVFQTNPCQHPVIILQDVHFSELEALLIFIYKGEVNIEQKNLPALLKAAETLQIRGLSGGDIFAKESYKRLAELEEDDPHESMITEENDLSRKKQKITKVQKNSPLDNLSTFQIQSEALSECSTSEKNKDLEFLVPDASTSPECSNIEMKVEQLEEISEENQTFSPSETHFQRLDTSTDEPQNGVRTRAEMELSYIQSKRGQTLMVVDNKFKLRKKSTLRTGEIRWDCTNKNCTYRMYTLDSTGEIIRWQREHNHPEDAAKIDVQKISSACKRKATENLMEAPSNIVRKELVNNGIPNTLTIRDLDNVKKCMYRARRKVVPTLTSSAEEVRKSLSERTIFTSEGEEFVTINEAVKQR